MLLEQIFDDDYAFGLIRLLESVFRKRRKINEIDQATNMAYQKVSYFIVKQMEAIKERRPDLFANSSGEARALLKALTELKASKVEFWNEVLDGETSIGFKFMIQGVQLFGLWSSKYHIAKIASSKIPPAKYNKPRAAYASL